MKSEIELLNIRAKEEDENKKSWISKYKTFLNEASTKMKFLKN